MDTNNLSFSASSLNFGPGESFPFWFNYIYLFAFENDLFLSGLKLDTGTLYLAGPGDLLWLISDFNRFPIVNPDFFLIYVLKNPYTEYVLGEGVIDLDNDKEEEFYVLDL